MSNCLDCGWHLDLFMVHNSVWTAAGLHPHQHCCLACVEWRLGRPLTITDFPPVPVNRAQYAAVGRLAEVVDLEREHAEAIEKLTGIKMWRRESGMSYAEWLDEQWKHEQKKCRAAAIVPPTQLELDICSER